jgi:hypothetical protein
MMTKILYIVAFGLGTLVVHHGCATESKSVVDRESGRGGASCGSAVCTGKTFCCNASCGICAPIGGACTQQVCLAPEASGSEPGASTPGDEGKQSVGPARPEQCGTATCTGNTHCCNASCGICVPPGGFCTQQFCEPLH